MSDPLVLEANEQQGWGREKKSLSCFVHQRFSARAVRNMGRSLPLAVAGAKLLSEVRRAGGGRLMHR